MAPRPRADRREPRPERRPDEVLGLAEVQRDVAHPRRALDAVDHRGVLLRAQGGLALAARRHRQPADEVGEPRERRGLQLRVLVQEDVELPRLVADPEVIARVAHDVAEQHEVRAEDLVHPADRLERVQAVLAALRVDVAGLGGELGARRMDRLAARLQQRRHRFLREPLDDQARHAAAQLVGDPHVAPGVPQPDRGRDDERPSRPGRRPRPPQGQAGAAGDVAQEEVHSDRVAHVREVPRALQEDEPPARQLGHAGAALRGHHLVRAPLDHHDGAAHRAAQRLRLLAVRDALLAAGHREELRRGVQPPRDAVLERLRRVRLGEPLGEEELQEAPEVPLPVLGVVLVPAAIAPRRLIGEVGHRGAERDHRPHPVGVGRRELERVAGAAREPDGDDRADAQVIEDRDRVGDRLGVGVRARVGGRVGQAAAAAVERHDARVARQVGDLELPHARVHDRPARQQQHDRLAAAVGLPPDAHAVPLEVPLGVRRARRRPGVRPPHPPTLTGYGRASYTWLNGVSATRRKRVNPPASTTSRMRASPAWAPRASPTSCESDAGVHSRVENP